MKILIAASEMAGVCGEGGLAEQVAAAAHGLAAVGHDVTVVLPFHRQVRENKALGLKRTRTRFAVQMGDLEWTCDVREASARGIKHLFVARDESFDRSGLYGVDGRDYDDNAARFLFFSKCVAELVRLRGPDVAGVFGWQAAPVAVFIRASRFAVPVVFAPVSLEFQGNFWSHDFALTNLPGSFFADEGMEFYGSMNFLKSGIVFADAVVLPGGRFAALAMTPRLGCGLEGVLRHHRSKIHGISPGVPGSSFPVVARDAEAVSSARRRLFGQVAGPETRVFLIDAQATGGMDLVFQTIDRIATPALKVVVLGGVPESSREALEFAIRLHAGRFVHREVVEASTAADCLAAGDFLLLPDSMDADSAFLCLAMKNGIVPVARDCEGLEEWVRDFDPVSGHGCGLVFRRAGVEGVADAVKRAFLLPDAEKQMLSDRCRALEFTPEASARRLERVFLDLKNRCQ
jgi:starch synthase